MSREIEPPFGARCARRRPRRNRLRRGSAIRLDAASPPLAPRRVVGAAAARRRPRSAARSTCAPIGSKARGDKRVEASGKVELRTRRETVLADWLTYDIEKRRDLGERRSHAAQGPRLDQRSRGQVPARARDRLLRRAALPYLARTQSHGEAKEIRFAGPEPVRGEQGAIHELRRAQQRLVPAQRTRSRSTSCARSAPRATRACTSSACP